MRQTIRFAPISGFRRWVGRENFHAGRTYGLCAPCSRVYRPDLPTEEKSAKNIERFPAGAGKMAL